MSFNTRDEYINAAGSEKVTLVHINANVRLINFTVFAGSVYQLPTPYFVKGIKSVSAGDLTQVFSLVEVVPGAFYYKPDNSTVYLELGDSSDPSLSELVSNVVLFYGSSPITTTNDLTDTGIEVYYDGRVTKTPGFKYKIGIDQGLVATVGTGSIELQNNDGELDEVYDRLIFENQEVLIYSWNRDLLASQAKLIFRGLITDTKYDNERVVYQVRDKFYQLNQNIPQPVYDETDNVNTSILGRYKRWVYGRVDGLKIQSVDQIGEGYTITGTVDLTADNTTITGTGTLFLNETSPNDTIIIGTQEFTIEAVNSDTELVINKKPTFTIIGGVITLIPTRGSTTKNREQFVAAHACAKLTKTVVSAKQFNRIELDSTVGLIPGDFVEFDSGDRIEIKSIAPGNLIVLRQNVLSLPVIGTSVIRQPIQQVFIGTELANSDDYSVSTISGETKLILDSDIEFNIAPLKTFSINVTFTNGTRTVTNNSTTPLTEIFESRDFIRSADVSYTTYYEILEVSDSEMTLRTTFTEATVTDNIEARLPEYIVDDTIVSVNLLGKTADGEPDGDWLQSSSDVVKDILTEGGFSGEMDLATFADVDGRVGQLMSIAFPLSPDDTQGITMKKAIDIINQTTLCALSIDNDLNLQYVSVIVRVSAGATTITDSDVVIWSISGKGSKAANKAVFRYRHKDIDRFTQESGSFVINRDSNFVNNYIGIDRTIEQDVYLYGQADAEIAAERALYYNSLKRSEIKIQTDLRLEGLEIGDVVILDFDRLYKKMGDSTTRKKVGTVIGRTVTGDKVSLDITDYGNAFNSSAFITDNTDDSFSIATSEQKLINGYITDPEGIVDDNEETNKINLIS